MSKPVDHAPTLPAAPAGVGPGLAGAAGRCLRHLSDELLRAMVIGLRTNAEDLEPGALFRGRDSGGCAVGVILRQLAPHAFRFGRIEFWLWQRWRLGVEPDVAQRFPQLQQLQRVFDDAVNEAKAAGDSQEPAKAVGLWLAASADAVLGARQASTRRRGRLPNNSVWRHRPHVRRPVLVQVTPAIADHQGSDMETTPCS